MRVSAYQQHNGYINKNTVNFKAHPDFAVLQKRYPDQFNVSSFFRHGIFAVPDNNYEKIIELFSKIFKDTDSKKTMLICGIGDSQEPFSHLATVKSVTKKPLEQVLDLNIVDIKDKPDYRLLFKQSYYDGSNIPLFVKESFVRTKIYRKLFGLEPKYRVDNEIFNYLKAIYSNPENAQWGTRIQDAIKEYPDEKFDVISINNVLQYIDNKDAVESTLQNAVRTLKSGGGFITDSFENTRDIILDTNQMEWVSRGIYRKK